MKKLQFQGFGSGNQFGEGSEAAQLLCNEAR